MSNSPSSPAPSARRLRARLAAAGAAIAVALVIAVPSTGALGAVPTATTPTPTPTATLEPGVAEFTLAPLGNGILTAGEALTVSVTLHNGTDAALSAGSVSLALAGRALTDRQALGALLDGDTSAVSAQEIAASALEPVDPLAETTEGILVPADSPALQNLEPGVYPLVATLTTPEQTFVSTSAVIVPDAAAAAVGIGVIVPITAAARVDGLVTAEELAELTGPAGALTDLLDSVTGTDAILAVDPALPAAIRVLGTAAPLSAVTWLARLDTLPNSRFALQFGDADVTAQVQAGITPPLQPTSLQAYMSPADFAPLGEPEPTATPSPTPTDGIVDDPTAPDYPDLATLLDIGVARSAVFWPATGTVDAGVVEALGALTVDDQSGLVVVDSEHTVAGADGDTVTAHGTAGGHDVLTYDTAISRELQSASTEDESVIRASHLTAATAYLAFAARETAGAPVLVTVDRGADRSRVALRTAITTAFTAPSTIPVSLGGLANAASGQVQISDASTDEARVAAASALSSEENALGQFATVLTDPSVLTGPERAEILQLLGLAWLDEPDLWTAAVALHRDETATTVGSVGVVPPSPIQLISSGAGIPVWVRNDLPYPVTVEIVATPDDLRLEVQERTDVTALPQSNTRVEIPVQAQIANGDVSIALDLISPTGVPIGEQETVEVHVRADWEGIGLVVLGVLAVGLVSLGLVRTILRRRAGRRADAVSPTEETPEAPAGPGAESGLEPTDAPHDHPESEGPR